jgi:hypothetical protein
MTHPARKIDYDLDTPRPGLPSANSQCPANDNSSIRSLADYIRDVAAYSGADYVPAFAKLWWLP